MEIISVDEYAEPLDTLGDIYSNGENNAIAIWMRPARIPAVIETLANHGFTARVRNK